MIRGELSIHAFSNQKMNKPSILLSYNRHNAWAIGSIGI